MKKGLSTIDRLLNKHALIKGVQIKIIDIPIKLFINLFSKQVVPMFPYDVAKDIVFNSINENCSTYKDGIQFLNIQDSNMPNLIKGDMSFDIFNSRLLSEIEKYQLSEIERERVIFKLCMLVETIAKPNTASAS